MIITREFVNCVCPKHGRTSCNDENLINSDMIIEDVVVLGQVVDRRIQHWYRCDRCFMLSLIGCDTKDLTFDIKYDISVDLHQPKIKIVNID